MSAKLEKLDDNTLKVTTTIPEEIIPSKDVVAQYSLDELEDKLAGIQKAIDVHNNSISELQKELTDTQALIDQAVSLGIVRSDNGGEVVVNSELTPS